MIFEFTAYWSGPVRKNSSSSRNTVEHQNCAHDLAKSLKMMMFGMFLSTLACAAALVAAQGTPSVKTEGGQLVFVTNDDLMVESSARGVGSGSVPGSGGGSGSAPRVGLLSTMAAINALVESNMATIRAELASEVGLTPRPAPPSSIRRRACRSQRPPARPAPCTIHS